MVTLSVNDGGWCVGEREAANTAFRVKMVEIRGAAVKTQRKKGSKEEGLKHSTGGNQA